MTTPAELLKKYNIPTPRYTSYPTVPFWKNNISEQDRFDILSQYDLSQGVDLYIHIPFCQQLCWYCGCNRVISKDQEKMRIYVQSIMDEWKIYIQKYPLIKIKSLHFGGGTPNNLSNENFSLLLAFFKPYIASDFIGAIELDPRVLNKDFLYLLKEYGFKRLSMGIQDFDPKVQKVINRVQPFELIKVICGWIKEIGFESFNFDLIYGLPKQNTKSITQTLEFVKMLSPDLMALYSYAHLPTQLKNQKLINEDDLPSPQAKQELYKKAKMGLEYLGYQEIGLDHFAMPNSFLGKAKEKRTLTRSFMGYTDKKSDVLIGLGASAISQTPESFVQNPKDLITYQYAIANSQIKINKSHYLSTDEKLEAQIIAELMCYSRIEPKQYQRFKRNNQIIQEIDQLRRDGLIELSNEGLSVTEIGKPFLRNIASVFDGHLRSTRALGKNFSSTA
ncbi:MAG: oxygen-independent coproporphyrinogen III oxidase [Halobacteriovoraceae bacterium]|nr:oxygen-independent coproporphyrinogen III oxidase [Halobacteriovoraceae bacterium]|tara:strand:- start:8674 stop:10014 length:1341 start_codon:yes stop_codon:yes gene_type:complete